MNDVLFQYHAVNPTTWVYLASLLMIGLFFKFGRFWSVRNLDLILLILLAPGLLLVHFGSAKERAWMEKRMEERDERLTMVDSDGVALTRVSAPKSPSGNKNEQDKADGKETSEDSANAGGASSALPQGNPQAAEKTEESPGSFQDGDDSDSPGNEDSDSEESDEAPGKAEPPPLPDPSQNERDSGRGTHRFGYIWLFAVSAIFLVRLLLDPMMVRRPLLEPSLTTGGLTFLGCSLFVFLMANVVNAAVSDEEPEASEASSLSFRKPGPGYQPLESFPDVKILEPTVRKPGQFPIPLSQTLAILAQLAVVLGIVTVGYKHFDNIRMGIGAATVYLMLPYTSQWTGYVSHAIPAALLVWAIAMYRRPVIAGALIGLCACNYYALFLLPLWLSFYWQRGLMRFVTGFLSALVLLVLLLIPASADFADFIFLLRKMFGIMWPRMDSLGGIWAIGWYPFYRIPLLTAFIAFSGTLALWPAQKNLGTLLSCSASVMVATQFWHGDQGTTCVGWYLPLMLLTVFRPNLEDRIALTVLSDSWFPRRKDARPQRNGQVTRV